MQRRDRRLDFMWPPDNPPFAKQLGLLLRTTHAGSANKEINGAGIGRDCLEKPMAFTSNPLPIQQKSVVARCDFQVKARFGEPNL